MTDPLPALFAALRALYARHEHAGIVLHDEPAKYYLGTHDLRAKDGYRTWFGGAQIRKAYVAAHLMPVYAHPDLLAAVSPALKKRQQGKSCFNFRKQDEALLAEFAALVEASFKRFQADGRFRIECPGR